MLEIVFILLISSSYSGIFSGTGLLDELQEKLSRACTRFGRFTVMLMMSIVTAAVFCNQTIATLMCCDLLKKPYLEGGSDAASMTELAIDMENTWYPSATMGVYELKQKLSYELCVPMNRIHLTSNVSIDELDDNIRIPHDGINVKK